MSWSIRTFEDADVFYRHVTALIEANPIGYTVLATNLARVRSNPVADALWFTLEQDGSVEAAAMWTPPYPVHLPFGDEVMASALARHLRTNGLHPPGVAGVGPAVSAFARFWTEEVGVATETVMEQRLFTIDEVRGPTGVPGSPRGSTPLDLPLVTGWGAAFQAEAMGPEPAGRSDFIDRLAGGVLWVWEDDNQPVSMTFASTPLAGVSRISYVYTPREHRRRGYAGALVAAVTSNILTTGDRAVLFTDLANPTSNHIYQDLGYRAVANFSSIAFTAR